MSWLRLFFGFKGRINRAQYWGAGILVNIILYAGTALIASPLSGSRMASSSIRSWDTTGSYLTGRSLPTAPCWRLWMTAAMRRRTPRVF